ncbi:cuticle protein 21.3 isoform X1 [Drosophila elegans]|uniref:cuticle protein 21.3 isoform X1 n=1 Tax=Drosophila elegans TaxID=30023 RepID=UPI0007E89986|nr:cuticle protein 21.3 isoform X1 [Drosophila elegans]
MAFKVVLCVVLVAILASVQAKPGGPAAYSISAPSVDHASVGNTQEHTVKGHYGQSSQSDYASQVQTAHSQSHVQRSSISNDAGLAPVAAHGYAAAPTHAVAAAPAYSLGYAGHTAPAQIQGVAYGGHGHGHYAATAPAVQISGLGHLGLGHSLNLGHSLGLGGYGGYGGYGYGGYGGYGSYSAAPAIAHGYLAHAPVAAAPVLKYAAAPSYAPGIIGHGIGLAAPAYAAPAYAAPAYATHLAGPVVKAAVAAPALVHTSVSGHGIHYGY